MAKSEALVFRAALEPEIYRDIEVPGDVTLYRLAEAIVTSFDFDFDHAFGFYSKLSGNFLKSPRQYELFADMGEADAGVTGVERTRATEGFARVGSKMLFLFDYGDEWLFLIELVERKPKQATIKLPRLLVSVGDAPQQYPSFHEGDEEEPSMAPRDAQPAIDLDKIDDAVLALLSLTLHDGYRAWKGFDWDAMNQLYEKGLIDDPRGKAKSVELTEDGLRRSQELFAALFVKPT